MNFIHYIESLIQVTEALKKQIAGSTKQLTVSKGDILIRNEERCHHLYFVESGLLRGYYYSEEKEITHWFAQEDEFATCLYSFISKEPAYETIQALEDCELSRISYADLQKLYVDFPETERIGRIITEKYYIKLEERLLTIQFKSAKERYHTLLNTNPGLLQRAPLGQIATYLGITQETLSRIRAEL